MLILRWGILTVGVWIAAVIVPGIFYESWQGLWIAALTLGILNTFVRPMLRAISLPFIIVTFGFFLLVINAILLGVTAWIVPGFSVSGFWPALGGSVVISVISMFFSSSMVERTVRPNRTYVSSPGGGVPPGKGPIIDV
jgi:putative membrane protein